MHTLIWPNSHVSKSYWFACITKANTNDQHTQIYIGYCLFPCFSASTQVIDIYRYMIFPSQFYFYIYQKQHMKIARIPTIRTCKVKRHSKQENKMMLTYTWTWSCVHLIENSSKWKTGQCLFSHNVDNMYKDGISSTLQCLLLLEGWGKEMGRDSEREREKGGGGGGGWRWIGWERFVCLLVA